MRFLVFILLAGRVLCGQTSCAQEHPEQGVFLCAPSPGRVPELFHLSAQANAPAGQSIAAYRVLVDDQVVQEARLAAPLQKLSLETNVRSPFTTGTHTLRLLLGRAGTAEVGRLEFYGVENVTLCNPFRRAAARTCTLLNTRKSLRWSSSAAESPATDTDEGYAALVNRYGQNLKRAEADTADAVAVDREGNLYAASHVFGTIYLRKYTPGGSLAYGAVVPVCGSGFLSVSAIAIEAPGRAWIAGNSGTCNGHGNTADPSEPTHGFVTAMDTTGSSATTPMISYLAEVENRITALRIGSTGKVYVAGITPSAAFPHTSVLSIVGSSAPAGASIQGFVAELDPANRGRVWTTLIPGMGINALAVNETADKVYVTGQRRCPEPAACDTVVAAGLSGSGQQIFFQTRLPIETRVGARAIALRENKERLLLAGESSSAKGLQFFLAALYPCSPGSAPQVRVLMNVTSNSAPEIAFTPALDAFESEATHTNKVRSCSP